MPRLKPTLAGLSAMAEQERGGALGRALASALSLTSEVLGPLLTEPLSQEALGQLEHSVLRHLELVDGVTAFWSRLERACDGFVSAMAASLTAGIRRRTVMQHDAVAAVAARLNEVAGKEGVAGKASCHHSVCVPHPPTTDSG